MSHLQLTLLHIGYNSKNHVKLGNHTFYEVLLDRKSDQYYLLVCIPHYLDTKEGRCHHFYNKAKAFLESKGYEVDRSYFGSEDGEAILYRKKGAEDWHFLCHLDPLFVEIEDVEGFVENIEESEEASK